MSSKTPSMNTETILQSLWDNALSEFKCALSPDQFQRLHAVRAVDDVAPELFRRSAQYKNRSLPQLLDRLDSTFQKLNFFSKSVSIYVQSNPEISALIWGSIYVLLELALRHKRHLEHVADILDHIAKHLPRIQSFANLLVISKRIEKAICNLYRDLIQFFLHAAVFFSRNPIVNILGISLRWRKQNKFQAEFARFLATIRENTHWIDSEANVALHNLSHDLTSRGYREILASMSAMCTPSATASPADGVPTGSSPQYRMIPYLANPCFFGRQMELQQLSDALVPKESATTYRQLRIFSIVGEGGVGKSQLALQFAYTRLSEFDAIFWISADGAVKIAQGYEDIAVEVGVVDRSGNQGSLGSAREATKRWFRATSRSWLLILDNVESFTALSDYWPTGARGSILTTTRSQNLIQPPLSAFLHLRCFSLQEGADFILSNIPPESLHGSPDASEDAATLSAACGGLPLALAQVVRHILTLHLSLVDARCRFSSPESFVSIQSESNRLVQADYYHQAEVASCWDAAIQSLDPPCLSLAQVFAYFDPDSIPEDLVILSKHDKLRGIFGTVTEIRSGFLTLLEHSLISKAGRSNTYSMHRLIQATILQRLSHSKKEDLFKLVLDCVDEFFPKYGYNDRLMHAWKQCGEALPHVQRLLQLCPLPPTTENTEAQLTLGQLFERASWYLQERGALPEAQVLLQAAINVAQRALQMFSGGDERYTTTTTTAGPTTSTPTLSLEHGEQAERFQSLLSDTVNSLGALHLKQGHFDCALGHFLDAIKLREKAGRPDLEMIYILKNAGFAYLGLSRVEEAYRAILDSLNMMEKWLETVQNPEDYRDNLASSIGALSLVLTVMGSLDEAWEAAIKSTELCQQVHDPESVVLSNCYTALGRIRRLQNRLDDAESYCLKALDIREKLYGQHEATALALHNYARILKMKGLTENAINFQEQSVAILRGLPNSERALARAMHYYVVYQQNRGRPVDEEAEKESLRLYQKHAGINTKDQKDVTTRDFDNLLPHNCR
ncbi:disease resistance protein RFL1 [Cercophora samala]|uniref:Disease resistance protein RFL1 n=1 Tax=Cercophora samala TaxID=330535 RepID=A0AA39ZAV1_9PEZI|nr:disease resistance protein RFL1 [Cercophora samala]